MKPNHLIRETSCSGRPVCHVSESLQPEQVSLWLKPYRSELKD
jgi:hypothetical protein